MGYFYINIKSCILLDLTASSTVASRQNKQLTVGTAIYMSHGTRKPVFSICNKVRLKQACSVTETS